MDTHCILIIIDHLTVRNEPDHAVINQTLTRSAWGTDWIQDHSRNCWIIYHVTRN